MRRVVLPDGSLIIFDKSIRHLDPETVMYNRARPDIVPDGTLHIGETGVYMRLNGAWHQVGRVIRGPQDPTPPTPLFGPSEGK